MSDVKILQTNNDQAPIFDKVEPIQFVYKMISVIANVQQQKEVNGQKIMAKGRKQILKQCSGKFSPRTFTALLGPSGCGKTTMLNLISGRQLSQNLQLYGELLINGQQTDNITKYRNYVGYVMQEDYMLPTFTPYQSFKFVADLRLSHLNQQEKQRVVNSLIKNLGLQKCKDTYIGDTRIRGVSGGEKKRTSIGLQLLVNPSIIFLDEPTTGLDSTTSLNLIRFLNTLAKQGRTIISTIHQPSSQIFNEFNQILLMVDGYIIYDGQAQKSMNYFAKMNLAVPKHTNPTDHYMKLLNKEGIMLKYIQNKQTYTDQQINEEFQQRVKLLVSNHASNQSNFNNQLNSQLGINFKTNENRQDNDFYEGKLLKLQQKFESSWCNQFGTIFKRSFINSLRQPLDLILKVFQAIFFGVICITLYYEQGTTLNEIIQNQRGVIFFLVMNTGFSYVFATVNLFNFERPVFIRERLSNTYSTSAYFFARLAAVQPVQIITVFLFIVISWFPSNLNNTPGVFFWSVLSLQLCAFMSSGFGLLLSTLIADAGVVMSLVPVLVIPFLLLGGFFVPLQTVFQIYYPFQYLSMFRYGYQSMIYAQYQNDYTTFGVNNRQLLTDNYNFQIPFWLELVLMAVIGMLLRLIALFAMYKISNPNIIPLNPPMNSGSLNAMPLTIGSTQNINNSKVIKVQSLQ